ncbi:glycoside hydrolase family 17 protein [Trichocladium antarcticum]|uniref:glucan endo-1,3-beta-D-glucosidase n=1 Tax=Trichocladium antarcticum TaxID=1450529 RepID=A0AAN6UMV2_9PEZI|nr:glycoside hydrolase family 17 protein [Trichocladium antarcticum]
MDEREPLGGPMLSPQPPHQQEFRQPYSPSQHQQDPRSHAVGTHPDSSFERFRAQRRHGQEPPLGPYAAAGATSNGYGPADAVPPAPPQHQFPQSDPEASYWGHGAGYPPTQQRPLPQNTITPGADNFSNVAAGGMAGIALSVADHNTRESGLNATHSPEYLQQGPHGQGYGETGMRPPADYRGDGDSHASIQGPNAAGAGVGYATPGQWTPRMAEVYSDDPYQNLSRHTDSTLGIVNPHDIEDDGDDGLEYGPRGTRTSMLSMGSSRAGRDGAAAAAGAGGAAAGGLLGGLVGRNESGSLYAPVHNSARGDASSASGASGGGGGSAYNLGAGAAGYGGEKAASKTNGKKWKWAIIIAGAVVVIAAIVIGVLFGVVFNKKKEGGDSSTSTAAGDASANGDVNSDSSEIRDLMNNPDLHKVFYGMDYTPLNTQYPDCVHNPPSQNNVTRDLAVISQLTNVVRLYGTDCNQTQMLIHAVNQLKLTDTVKIWLGVWQDNNATTNARQLSQMWDILDEYGDSPFKGIIVANEILFREQTTITKLGSLLEEVRANLTARGLRHLPVATSDLGDKWTAGLAAQSDAIMANIHPFFAGATAADAADWTMYFWGNKTSSFLKKDSAMNIIAETGWPSQGGTACGNEWETDCPDKAVAGIDELNVFMEDWVCRALRDGTEYLWFEAFDEPWKILFNTKGKAWEDHWGLFDVDRNLKPGLKIPDCGGKRVS